MNGKQIDPHDYVVAPDTEFDTVDLMNEELILRDGRRLTEELAERLAHEAQDEIRRRNLIPGQVIERGGPAFADHSRARARAAAGEGRTSSS